MPSVCRPTLQEKNTPNSLSRFHSQARFLPIHIPNILLLIHMYILFRSYTYNHNNLSPHRLTSNKKICSYVKFLSHLYHDQLLRVEDARRSRTGFRISAAAPYPYLGPQVVQYTLTSPEFFKPPKRKDSNN
jgi:hypothetical protein